MSDDKVLSEVVRKKKMRIRFIATLVVVFLIFTVLSFLLLPAFESNLREVARNAQPGVAESVGLLTVVTAFFKISWALIGVGCGVLAFLAWTGALDRLIPLLQIVVVLAGAGAIAAAFLAYYAQKASLGEGL
ncbi:MAG: hypothetical protein ACYTAF_08200 [Planctomycetota bacterium]|jgi:hypothetical protein